MPRLNILTDSEQIEFDYPPTMTIESRAACFAIDAQIKKLRGETNKVGFLLQYAYFKASRRFFHIKRFRIEDIQYAAKLVGVSFRSIKLQQYKNATPNNHQAKILELFNCKAFQDQKLWIEKEIALKVERIVESKALFFEVLHQMHNHKVEIPSYHTLSELISDHYIAYEKKLLDKIKAGLNEELKIILQSLLLNLEIKYESKLTNYKTINQSLQPKAIQASVKTFEKIRDLIIPLMPLIKLLGLTQQSCEYYSTWVKKLSCHNLSNLQMIENYICT